ncbi:MAG: MFS transporter [Chitinophagaceae bacterium]|nr:MAG: MFS transporter [Chitinophagaceae bacterium]
MKIINRTVLVLSLVSMFADVASEMLYPIIPVYLRQIGFSVFAIGVLEGVAGFTAGLTKGYFGKWSDEIGRRLPFVRSGYFLSALSKPMMAFFTLPLWVFFTRCVDRLGKGLRTAPRDALLADNSTEATRARVFGFHRSLDTLGAAIGPCLALAFLWRWPGQYTWLFWVAFIPGMLSVALTFLLHEKRSPSATLRRGGFFSFFGYWKIATPQYKRIVPALFLFLMFNSSDVFLLLKTREVSGSDTTTITAYIFYNMVFAGASYPLGALADRLGKRNVLIGGLFLFAIVYTLFACVQQSISLLFLGFLLYGLYAAATEGVAKAWIAGQAHTDRATAIGFYTSGESLCTLFASLLTGFLWTHFNPFFAFGASVLATLLVIVYLLIIKSK